jgi:hypothetical protein
LLITSSPHESMPYHRGKRLMSFDPSGANFDVRYPLAATP